MDRIVDNLKQVNDILSVDNLIDEIKDSGSLEDSMRIGAKLGRAFALLCFTDSLLDERGVSQQRKELKELLEMGQAHLLASKGYIKPCALDGDFSLAINGLKMCFDVAVTKECVSYALDILGQDNAIN